MIRLAAFDVYQTFQFEVLQQLVERDDITLEYYISGVRENYHGDKDKIASIKNMLDSKETRINENIDFFDPKNILRLNNCPYHLNDDLLDQYSGIERMFMILTDRATASPISSHNKQKYYHILLNYFIDIIRDKQITHAICFDTPHNYYSWILYQLLLHHGVEVIRMEHHYFTDYSMVLNTTSFPSLPQATQDDRSVEEIKANLPDHLLEILKTPDGLKEIFTSAELKRTSSNKFYGHFFLLKKYITKYLSNLAIGLFPFIYKKHLHHFTALNGVQSELSYRLLLNKQLKNNYKLSKYYLDISQEAELDTPYVFLGLHMQPEKTTMPLGGHASNQLLMIKILSDSLPQGWKLYVKEHPNQFNFKKANNPNFRDKEFYDCVRSMKNVTWINLKSATPDLIKHAKMVATVTGTLGWEALQQGKPVLVFGDAYYRSCLSTRYVDSVESCQKAIEELDKKIPADVEKDMIRHLEYYINNRILIGCSNWELKMEYNSRDRKEQINELVETILYRLAK